MICMTRRPQDWWRWGAPLLLCCSVWLLPVSLRAQPFDVENRRHAVVRILGDRGNNIGSGSLIKVDGKTGYILTAYHVIQRDVDQSKTSVKVQFYTDQEVEARISRNRLDQSNDIAVLVLETLPATSLMAIPLGSASAVRDTQRVYALGHPSAEATWAITEGTVSRKQGGKLHFSGTAVNRGNSGGPLLDERGVLVAMNLRLGEGLGSALTWDVIRPLIEGWVPGLSAASQSTDSGTGTSSPPAPPPAPPATRRGKDKKEMLLVPEGWFQMGSTEAEIKAAYALGKKYDTDTPESRFDDEKPQHRVWVDAFYMDKHEVTVGEYKAFVTATGRQGLPEWVAKYASKENHPVVGVNWEDADAYCRWAEKQLPTEAQWEKAARGDDGRQYPWGNDAITGKRANYCDTRCEYRWKDKGQDDGYPYTAPVGSFPDGKSPYGIEDLAGNVWEWVQDWYDATYYQRSSERNPVNETSGAYRVLRGGSWAGDPAHARVALRDGLAPGDRIVDVGFRCVIAGAASRL